MKILSTLVGGLRAGRMLRRLRVDDHSAELVLADFGVRCAVGLTRERGGLPLGVAIAATAGGAAVGLGVGTFVLGGGGIVAVLGGGALALAGAALAARAVGYKLDLTIEPDALVVMDGGRRAAS
jgi:hypothetical protein